jgi:hypothetical protein
LAASFAAHADTFTVTNTASSGPGSLAQAMQDAYYNFGGTTNVIVFDIPGPGVHTIVRSAGLPLLSSTLIDGYTQPGAQPNTLTNGDNAVLLVEVRGQLSLLANCTVRGLVINSSSYAGISFQGNGVVEGNFLGTDASGTVAVGNTYHGVYVQSGNVRIGGAAPAARNVISGNRFAGIAVYGTGTNTVIQGNLIGTDATGARPLGNALYGVENISSYSPGVSATKIGGTNTGEGNVIAFNGLGVWIEGGQGCSILGNAIFANQGLGIDLGYGGAGAFIQPDGPTPNHPGGTNSGATCWKTTRCSPTLLRPPAPRPFRARSTASPTEPFGSNSSPTTAWMRPATAKARRFSGPKR